MSNLPEYPFQKTSFEVFRTKDDLTSFCAAHISKHSFMERGQIGEHIPFCSFSQTGLPAPA